MKSFVHYEPFYDHDCKPYTVKGKIDFPQIGFEKGTTERGFQR